MTEDKLKKLRTYYYSLLEQKRIFDDAAVAKQLVVQIRQFRVLTDELHRIETDFPGLLPSFGYSRDTCLW
jgi:hypothetical protein